MKTVLVAIILVLSVKSLAQMSDTLMTNVDSIHISTDTTRQNNKRDNTEIHMLKMNVPAYFILFGQNAKMAITKPFHMSGKDWARLGQFATIAGALTFADEPIQRAALQWRNNTRVVRTISQHITLVGGNFERYLIGGLGIYGIVFKDQRLKRAALLASQSYMISGAIEGALKYLTGRERPVFHDPMNETGPSFHGPFYKEPTSSVVQGTNHSFPSGHTTVAFAAATVFAMEYRHRPAIPIIVYTAASLVGISRITENKHWATDVLAGAALGYLIGRLTVNNFYGYPNAQTSKKNKNTMSFHLQYRNRVLMPGFIYTFR